MTEKSFTPLILAKMTEPEVIEYLRTNPVPSIMIPIGPVELHGPHLPVGIDFLNAEAVALLVAGRYPCIVAPTIPVMFCGSSSDRTGTISVSCSTICAIAYDMTKSLIDKGFKRILFGSGHGGDSVRAVISGINEAKMGLCSDCKVGCLAHRIGGWWEKVKIETPNDGHAGEVETSAAMYLHRHLVRGPLPPADFHEIANGMVVTISKSGINGDPQKASWGKGKIIIESIVGTIVEWFETP